MTGGQCFVHHLFTSGKTASLAAGVLGHGLGSFTDCVSSIGFNNSSLLFCLIYSSKDLYRWRFSLTVVIKSTFNFRPKEKIKSLKSVEGFYSLNFSNTVHAAHQKRFFSSLVVTELLIVNFDVTIDNFDV